MFISELVDLNLTFNYSLLVSHTFYLNLCLYILKGLEDHENHKSKHLSFSVWAPVSVHLGNKTLCQNPALFWATDL